MFIGSIYPSSFTVRNYSIIVILEISLVSFIYSCYFAVNLLGAMVFDSFSTGL